MKYYLQNGIQQTGPFTLEELSLITDKDIFYVWCEGEANWKPLKELMNSIETENISKINLLANPKVPNHEKNYAYRRFIKFGLIVPLSMIILFVFFLYKSHNEKTILKEENRLFNRIVVTSGHYYPLVIRSMIFQNGTTSFEDGSKIKKKETPYLVPIIFFQRLHKNTNPEVHLVLKMLKKALNNSNFILVDNLFKKTLELTNDDPTAFFHNPSSQLNFDALNQELEIGNYKIQVWFENKCLYEGNFEMI